MAESPATVRASTVMPPRSRFYVNMGLVGVGVATIGFFGTYTRPLFAGTFRGPPMLHWHGAFAMGWVLLFALQPWLIRRNVFRLHRAFGVLGVLLAIGAAVTMIPAQYVGGVAARSLHARPHSPGAAQRGDPAHA